MNNQVCEGLCQHTRNGPLDPVYVPTCMSDTPKAISCYMEGIGQTTDFVLYTKLSLSRQYWDLTPRKIAF